MYLLEKPEFDEVSMQASILNFLTSLVSDIKVAIVAGRDVIKEVKEVRDIVLGVKAANFDEASLYSSSPSQRIVIMKKKRRLVVEVLFFSLLL